MRLFDQGLRDDVIIAVMAVEQEMTETGIANDNNSSAS